jgi:hypothetical protein
MGTLEKSSYAPMKRAAMRQYGTFVANELVIFLNVPKYYFF